MVRRVTYWLCSQNHEHLSPKDADLCDAPYRGGETVQWRYFERGDKFVTGAHDALRGYFMEGRRIRPEDLTIWVVTEVWTVPTSSRPGPQYLFERAAYTLVSSDGLTQRVSGRALRDSWTGVKNTRRALLAYLRSARLGNLSPNLRRKIGWVVGVITAKADGFNPHLKETGD